MMSHDLTSGLLFGHVPISVWAWCISH